MKAKILKCHVISPTAKLFTLRAEGNFSFLPGQYTSFSVNGAIRTYSICSLPEELPLFEFCVRQIANGVGTDFLNENVGKEIELTEPAGDFVIRDSPERIMFLASGTGIAPVRPMLKDYLRTNPAAEVELVYQLKGDEYLFQEEWESMKEKCKNFKLTTIHSNAPQPPLNLRGGEGELYVVGSPAFVGQTLQLLEKLGYNRQSIKADIWDA